MVLKLVNIGVQLRLKCISSNLVGAEVSLFATTYNVSPQIFVVMGPMFAKPV
jgi:hypothetical protein